MSLTSVIIPCYNNSDLLNEAIDSVLTQIDCHFEIIVIDDGSIDHPDKVVSQYKLSNIKIIRQKNSGPSTARNRGIKYASGDYIAFLDSDDIWLENKLRQQVAILDKKPEYGLIFSDGYRWKPPNPMREQSRLSRIYSIPKFDLNAIQLFKINMIPTSSIVFRRCLVEDCGLLDENLFGGEDFEFFMRLLKITRFYYIDKPLICYRVHNKNTSSFITKENVEKRIKVKLESRKVVLKRNPQLLSEKTIYLFSIVPELMQYLILFIWRLRYSASKKFFMNSLVKYVSKLIN